jgi:hypothetical protein
MVPAVDERLLSIRLTSESSPIRHLPRPRESTGPGALVNHLAASGSALWYSQNADPCAAQLLGVPNE